MCTPGRLGPYTVTGTATTRFLQGEELGGEGVEVVGVVGVDQGEGTLRNGSCREKAEC